MRVYQTSERISEATAVALGFFDGIHRGHRAVIASAVDYAKKHGVTPVVFTFFESPKAVLTGSSTHKLLTDWERLQRLKEMGVEVLYLEHFSAMRTMSAESFAKDFLHKRLGAVFASCGFNYRFGVGGKGTAESLRDICGRIGMETKCLEPIMHDKKPISSTRIRLLLSDGNIEEANLLLGHSYGFCGQVIHGNKIGRTLGIPTLNQEFPEEMFVPKLGAYASVVTLGGQTYCGVTNIGWKPTVGSDRLLAETWLPDYSGADFYGSLVDLRLEAFIRPERKFESLAAMKEEILRNGDEARRLMNSTKIC